MPVLRRLCDNLLTNGRFDGPIGAKGGTPLGPRPPHGQRPTPLGLAHEPSDIGSTSFMTKLFGWTMTRNWGSGWAWKPLRGHRLTAVPADLQPSTHGTTWLHAQPDDALIGQLGCRLLTRALFCAGEVVASYRWCEMTQVLLAVVSR